ncbi:MAG TPA: hypothetical protein EYP91_05640 [Gammaproteobacteria bacterium]|nr:hypothetical protein [Gammaproteobacteria bacterium]
MLEDLKLIQSKLFQPDTTPATVNAHRLRLGWTTGAAMTLPANIAVIPQGQRQYLRFLKRL